MAKEGEKRSDNKLLVGILVFLAVVIVGLVAGIVVVNMQKGDAPQEVEKTNEEIVDDILDMMKPMNIEDSEKYLDIKLEEYRGTDLEFRIIMMKMNVYINGGEPANAVTVAEDIDDENLSDEEKMEYYMTLAKAYSIIGDEDNSNYYDNKYGIMYNEIFDGGGGGE